MKQAALTDKMIGCAFKVHGVLGIGFLESVYQNAFAHELVKAHEVQMVNYLTATGIEIGLLLNFGAPRLEVKRKTRLYVAQPPAVFV